MLPCQELPVARPLLRPSSTDTSIDLEQAERVGSTRPAHSLRRFSSSDLCRVAPSRLEMLASMAMILSEYPHMTFAGGLLPQSLVELFSNSQPRELNPDSAFDLLVSVSEALDMNDASLVLSLVVLERLGLDILCELLATRTWQNTVMSALILATKMSFDEQTWLCDVKESLNHRYNDLTEALLHSRETIFLKAIDYKVDMSSATYTNYLQSVVSVRHKSETQRLLKRKQLELQAARTPV
mmetsp:Transcript_15343/g.38470  ORF Transcript_15343/g.38470 Transcript_15343/m.38470 type:complete len:240 (-) Transcript_15343:531-1250(-)